MVYYRSLVGYASALWLVNRKMTSDLHFLNILSSQKIQLPRDLLLITRFIKVRCEYIMAAFTVRVYRRHWRPPPSMGTCHEAVSSAHCPQSIPSVTHLPQSTTVTVAGSCNVLNLSHNRSFLRHSLPSYIPSVAEILPKADKKGHSRTSTRLPVTILRVNRRHTCYPSRSSSRIREKQ